MKTNLNKSISGSTVQKAALRTAAVIISLVLISFTVTAQDFWKQLLTNNGISDIAMVLVDHSSEAVVNDVVETSEEANSEVSAFYYSEIINEPALDLENWMLDKSYFKNFNSQEIISTEMPTELENWMFNEAYFCGDDTEEEHLELESWMTDDNHWN